MLLLLTFTSAPANATTPGVGIVVEEASQAKSLSMTEKAPQPEVNADWVSICSIYQLGIVRFLIIL